MKFSRFIRLSALIFLCSVTLTGHILVAQEKSDVYPGADERTPSLSQYFSWINNTNEGSTEAQTLANLEFFKWLRDEYGMILDIYVISAGTIDKARWYGSMDSPEFKTQFPNGLDPIYQLAKSMDTRLGTWGGPDGFGDTPEEEQARIDMIVSLCKDYEFRLLKMDAVVGQLRDEKQDAFIRMMNECRKYSPDLIFLNHRLNLSDEAKKHATTSLWGGAETYIDVHMPNWQITAPHHRASAISRNTVPELIRLTEDHGVCLSSCLDYWEDDLILQAFNRALILSPQLYGNPWFLRDDEYPKLARIFNLARKYGDIMVDGILLPESQYGEKAVSRGNDETRLVTMRNLTWHPKTIEMEIGPSLGLEKKQSYEVRSLHPYEKIHGSFKFGEKFELEVEPFRSALVLVCPKGEGGVELEGIEFEVVQDLKGKPIRIDLLGMPGEEYEIRINQGKKKKIVFEGDKIDEPFHRHIGTLESCSVPLDAEALYEATVFSADNNALEIRSLIRSGESDLSAVQLARQAFLEQPLLAGRGVWDRYMFDGDPETSFYVARRRTDNLVNRGSLRIDFGSPIHLDELIIETKDDHGLQPWKFEEAAFFEYSSDLKNWTASRILAGSKMKISFDSNNPVRYIRFSGTPDRITEIYGFLDGRELDREQWRGSNLFSHYNRFTADTAWSISTQINEIHPGSYIAVALEGEHGIEGAYAALRIDGEFVGAPDRSPSYPCNPWEYPVAKAKSHYTYYIPLNKEMEGKKIDIVVLGMKGGEKNFRPESWLTCYPRPHLRKELIIE